MVDFNDKHRAQLEDKFGERVTFDYIERRLYGHDIAAMPRLVKPLIGDTTPDAVVQPETEEELIDLARWASEHNIPLTPRGKATSGYGGVLPVKNGVVIDFYRMKKVISVDPEEQTATPAQVGAPHPLPPRVASRTLHVRMEQRRAPEPTATPPEAPAPASTDFSTPSFENGQTGRAPTASPPAVAAAPPPETQPARPSPGAGDFTETFENGSQ